MPRVVARTLVAKEIARIVYFMLRKQAAFDGTFKRLRDSYLTKTNVALGSS